MKRFILSRPAERDLQGIQAYLIERAGPRIARKVMRDIRDAIRFIAKRPLAGHLREDLAEPPVRFWTVYSYMIVYDVTRSPLEILRVLHGARDVAVLLAP